MSKRAGRKAINTKILNAVLSIGHIEDIVSLSQEIHEREFNWEYECDDDSLICRSICCTTWESFCRFGDRNRMSAFSRMIWIREKGEPLDLQAMYMSADTGKEFTPGQLAQFMMENEGGCNSFPYLAKTAELKKTFKQLTGFNWTPRIHDLIEPLQAGEQYNNLAEVA